MSRDFSPKHTRTCIFVCCMMLCDHTMCCAIPLLSTKPPPSLLLLMFVAASEHCSNFVHVRINDIITHGPIRHSKDHFGFDKSHVIRSHSSFVVRVMTHTCYDGLAKHIYSNVLQLVYGAFSRTVPPLVFANKTPNLSSVCVRIWLRNVQKPKRQNSIFRALSGESFTIYGRRCTPPLSPSVGKLATPTVLKGENLPGAAEYVAMLKESGVPPLASVTDLKQLVHAAPRAWLRDFKIRGGR